MRSIPALYALYSSPLNVRRGVVYGLSQAGVVHVYNLNQLVRTRTDGTVLSLQTVMHYGTQQFHASWVTRTHTKQADTTARKRRQSPL